MKKELLNIIEKSAKLFAKYGIKSVTMDDIAKELRISKKTLYQYVKDKNDLVTQVFDFEMEKTAQEFEKIFISSKNALEKILDVSMLMNCEIKDVNHSLEFDLQKYYPEQYSKIQAIRRKYALDHHILNLKQGKEEGLYRKDLNCEVIAKLFYLRLEALMTTDIFTIEEYTSNDVFTQDFIYHIRGIASEEGLKLLEEKLKDKELNK